MTPLQKMKARKEAIDAMPAKPQQPKLIKRQFQCKAVLLITTTKTTRFPSLQDAAQWLSTLLGERCLASAIGQAIRRGNPYKGYKFKYEEDCK